MLQITFILVEPARAQNVGAVARAIKTMGFEQLSIVNSVVHQQKKAQWVAHGATDILANAQCYCSLQEAIKSFDLVIATTARKRGQLHHYLSPEALKVQLTQKAPGHSRVAVLFGREESGLSNDELALAHLVSYLPLAQDYPSLNLSQAVMLYAYELTQLNSTVQPELLAETVAPASVNALLSRLSAVQQRLAISSDEKLALWLKESLPLLTQRDVNMVHSLLNQFDKLE